MTSGKVFFLIYWGKKFNEGENVLYLPSEKFEPMANISFNDPSWGLATIFIESCKPKILFMRVHV